MPLAANRQVATLQDKMSLICKKSSITAANKQSHEPCLLLKRQQSHSLFCSSHQIKHAHLFLPFPLHSRRHSRRHYADMPPKTRSHPVTKAGDRSRNMDSMQRMKDLEVLFKDPDDVGSLLDSKVLTPQERAKEGMTNA